VSSWNLFRYLTNSWALHYLVSTFSNPINSWYIWQYVFVFNFAQKFLYLSCYYVTILPIYPETIVWVHRVRHEEIETVLCKINTKHILRCISCFIGLENVAILGKLQCSLYCKYRNKFQLELSYLSITNNITQCPVQPVHIKKPRILYSVCFLCNSAVVVHNLRITQVDPSLLRFGHKKENANCNTVHFSFITPGTAVFLTDFRQRRYVLKIIFLRLLK